MNLDMCYIYMHNKFYICRKIKKNNSLKGGSRIKKSLLPSLSNSWRSKESEAMVEYGNIQSQWPAQESTESMIYYVAKGSGNVVLFFSCIILQPGTKAL